MIVIMDLSSLELYKYYTPLSITTIALVSEFLYDFVCSRFDAVLQEQK
jgi:hypothetical protein